MTLKLNKETIKSLQTGDSTAVRGGYYNTMWKCASEFSCDTITVENCNHSEFSCDTITVDFCKK